MIEGVTVVETIAQEMAQPIEQPIIVILGLLAISIAAICESLSFFKGKHILEGAAMLSVIVVSLFVGLFSCGVIRQPKQETLYIITVDDTVSAKELHENFDVISVNGDKYTVKLINTIREP